MINETFWKMSGSGNDFVFLDRRRCKGGPEACSTAEADRIRQLCSRRTGVGADGVAFLENAAPPACFGVRYYNADGSRAALCGNATLCAIRLAFDMGIAPDGDMLVETDAGRLFARMSNGIPQVDLAAVTSVRSELMLPRHAQEFRIGFAVVGVPHLVVVCAEAEAIDVAGRGKELRQHPSLTPEGANVNFVSRLELGWRIRTFERGVEAETLACGTGAAASAFLLSTWGLVDAGTSTAFTTASRKSLEVRIENRSGEARPSLRGEGRIVFRGVLGDLT